MELREQCGPDRSECEEGRGGVEAHHQCEEGGRGGRRGEGALAEGAPLAERISAAKRDGRPPQRSPAGKGLRHISMKREGCCWGRISVKRGGGC